MTWEYTKDNRTDNQVKENYNLGKKKEEEILKRIGLIYFMLNDQDKFGEVKRYTPDAFILYNGEWRPTEIKYSSVNLKYIELKQNQADVLSAIGGLYLQATPTKYTINSALEIMSQGMLSTDTYCNKPCYRLNFPDWKKFN